MSNPPNNPPGESGEQKGPWVYAGGSQPVSPVPGYVPPTPKPVAPVAGAAASALSAAKPKVAEKTEDDASLASIVDTIEAIIIALIIALTFRAFVVEAFVIPTGSMAPTLLGAHFNVVCPKCGYVFTRDAPVTKQYMVDGRGMGIIADQGDRAELTSNRNIPVDPVESRIRCPNCQYVISPDEMPQYLGKRLVSSADRHSYDMPFAWANNGDRILVLKYLYAVMEPERFDVIVFKEPMSAQDNFIKRLIGLPKETIEVINGDVFVAPPGKLDPADRVIARKPEFVQKNVWQLVYDNDYYPTDANKAREDGSAWTNPWIGEGGTAEQWKIAGPVFHYLDAGPGSIGFSVSEPYTFNVLGYNDDRDEPPTERSSQLTYCGDLHLEAVWTPQKSGDSITLSLGQTRNEFRARWSALGGVELQRFNPETRAFEGVGVSDVRTVPTIEAGKSYKVCLDNVDHAVRLYIDDQLVLEHLVAWNAKQAIAEYQQLQDNPPAESQKPEIRIEVGGACTLSHVKLFRDLYYAQTTLLPSRSQRDFVPGQGTAMMGHPLTLRDDEFFAMGDNSRRSHDGRSWAQVYPSLDDLGTRRGVVPRRYLLGKAFFVYWPAGYRITSNDSIPYLSDAPLVPNVGDMRMIR